MKNLTREELDALVLESEGRAFSWVDSPEWCCGQRKSTFMARDGVKPEYSLAPGTRQALAYVINDAIHDHQHWTRQAGSLKASIESINKDLATEDKRKAPRKTRIKNLLAELRQDSQDLTNVQMRLAELRAKHFSGYERNLGFEISK